MAEEEKQQQEASQEEAQPETSTEQTTSDNNTEEEQVEVPEKFKSIVQEIEQMSVLDLSELVKILEKKFGVSASAPAAAVQGAGSGGGEEEQAEEQTEFDVELTEAGSNKIGVIKAVRELTDMGLKDAKELVDGVPKVIKEGATKEDADNMKAKLEEAGATVTLK